MIIDKDGNLIEYWERKNGRVINDSENEYKINFHICIPYTEQQKAMFAEIKLCKRLLSETDYKALKYADGAYSEEEYAPIKADRAKWRARINEIEAVFQEPTMTRAEIDKAEALAIAKIREGENANSKLANSTNIN